jgi:membrane-associated protease RseP (regulator of RpoE activity)
MKPFLRPYRSFQLNLGFAAIAAVAAGLAFAPPANHAQAQELTPIFSDPSPFAAHAAAAGYLGVDVADVDADKAQALKLKEARGALITLIDHDAPAGQVGLKVNDVVLALNGQNVEGAEQLRRMLREIPPGRQISLEISRDGNIQTLAVQLADRKVMEHDVWDKIGIDASSISPVPPLPAMGIMAGGDAPVPPGGLHMSIFTGSLNVGALVEPLTSQMAEYMGVPGGLMVKQVARRSEAAAAGLKAFDVILKVGSDSIMTSADWDRALRSNVGKPVQVTILRDKKQQNLTLQVDSKHRGAVEYQDLFGLDNDAIMAEASPFLDPDFARALSAQADALRDSMKNFKIDPEQMNQFRQQMEEFRKSFNQEQMKQLQHQMEQFQRQMEQWQEPDLGNFV